MESDLNILSNRSIIREIIRTLDELVICLTTNFQCLWIIIYPQKWCIPWSYFTTAALDEGEKACVITYFFDDRIMCSNNVWLVCVLVKLSPHFVCLCDMESNKFLNLYWLVRPIWCEHFKTV